VIDIRLIGGAETVAKLGAIPAKLRGELDHGIGRLALRAQALVQDKLSGGVLKVRSGRLRASIGVEMASGEAGVSSILSLAVPYAAVHEYGFSGTQNVRESLRIVKQAFGRPISPVQATIRAHARQVDLPERSFLRSALAELEGSGLIAREMDGAMARAVA
jgi:phage gpG-like protein